MLAIFHTVLNLIGSYYGSYLGTSNYINSITADSGTNNYGGQDIRELWK